MGGVVGSSSISVPAPSLLSACYSLSIQSWLSCLLFLVLFDTGEQKGGVVKGERRGGKLPPTHEDVGRGISRWGSNLPLCSSPGRKFSRDLQCRVQGAGKTLTSPLVQEPSASVLDPTLPIAAQ